MTKTTSLHHVEEAELEAVLATIPYSSNSVRLDWRQWLAVLGIVLAFGVAAPRVWQRAETPAAGADYRLPREQAADYWAFEHWARQACQEHDMIAMGDSVMWGQYVREDQTLTHYLNERMAGGKEVRSPESGAATRERSLAPVPTPDSRLQTPDRCANLGVDGMHPVAMAGLLEYYGGGIRDRRVLLHFNPLWLSSPKVDLRLPKEFAFNHPRLVPQLFPRIPCYAESYSARIGVVVGREIEFPAWADHLRYRCFDSSDLPTWSLAYPYENPLEAMLTSLRNAKGVNGRPQDALHQLTSSPVHQLTKLELQDFPWVQPEQSLQWRCFLECLDRLQGQGNRVFVLIGPLNEHMMTPTSVEKYNRLKDSVQSALRAKGVPFLAPLTLPRRQYADASHPLSEGYDKLADEIAADVAFKAFEGR